MRKRRGSYLSPRHGALITYLVLGAVVVLALTAATAALALLP